MKKVFILTILFVLGASIKVFSQALQVTSFKQTSDLTASRFEKTDINGVSCGLIKVWLPMTEAKFVGNVVESTYKDGEWWVYMTKGSKRITIKTSKYPPLSYEFSQPIQSKVTYVMTIADPNTRDNKSALWRSAVLPGWGQFYKDRNGRGTLIVIGETLTLAAGGLSLYNELNQKSIMDKPEVSYQDYIAAEKSYEQWNTARHISFITAAVIYSLNLVDAYLTPAKSQNNIVFTPNVMNANGEMAVGATMSIRF